jgi:predicted DNA binding CopG/RHH family protein
MPKIMAKQKPKKLPDMTEWTAREIHEFWKTHSSADYWDETEEVEVEVGRRPRRPVSVKLSDEDVKALKRIAEEKGMGYTTLLRVWIKEKLREAQTTS